MKTGAVERSGQGRFYRALFLCTMILLGIALVKHFRYAGQGEPGVFGSRIPLRAGLAPGQHVTVSPEPTNVAQALLLYTELTGRTLLPSTNGLKQRIDDWSGGRLSGWGLIRRVPPASGGIAYHADGLYTAAEIKNGVEELFRTNGVRVVADGARHLRIVKVKP